MKYFKDTYVLYFLLQEKYLNDTFTNFGNRNNQMHMWVEVNKSGIVINAWVR